MPHPSPRRATLSPWIARLASSLPPGIYRRFLVPVALALLLFALASTSGAPVARAQPSASQQLADRFAPIAYLRTQSRPCDRAGEGYFPAPVDTVLGNPEVALRRDDGGRAADDPVITMGPTAQDLAGLGSEYYLDFPGNPRRSGCVFESDFKRFAVDRNVQPATYAHIVIDQKAGKLVLQFWSWYYFNDWNNTHESDWEMFQLVFDATSAEEALVRSPSLIGYAQHGGGEVARWGDEKFGIEDGHPVVYPAAGSHGTYFEQQDYIGWGERGTGFGCDTTTSPSTRTPLNVILIPDSPPRDGPLAWVYFGGRWGERQTWEFNGPLGPNTGTKWNDPLGAMENWRSSSLRIPASRAIGPTATGFFCAAVEDGSRLLTSFGNRPLGLVTLALVAVTLLVSLFVTQRRALGSAMSVYRRHLRTFAGIGFWAIPIGIVFNGFFLLVRDNPPMEWALDWLNDTAGARLAAVATIGGLQQGALILVVSPPVIWAVQALRGGRQPRVRESFRSGFRHFRPLVLGFVIAYAAAGLLAAIVVGIPLAIWLGIRWQFYGQAAILGRAATGWDTLRTSAAAVRGHWWQALKRALVFQLVAILPGPLVGVALLLGGKSSVQFANVLSSVVYAVAVPVAVIGLTLAYEEFRERNERQTARVVAPERETA